MNENLSFRSMYTENTSICMFFICTHIDNDDDNNNLSFLSDSTWRYDDDDDDNGDI